MTTYTVQYGDTPASIAHRLTGDIGRTPELFRANAHKPFTLGRTPTFRDLYVGEKLNVPRNWGLGDLPSGVSSVAQNTDNSGDLRLHVAPGTSSAVNGGIPHGALFYIMGPPVDINNNPWPDPSNDMPNADPNANAWYPAASADFTIAGFAAAGPGTGGERLLTITNQTTPILPPAPNPNPNPNPTPPPVPPPTPTPSTTSTSSNTGLIIAGLVGVAALGVAGWYAMRHHPRLKHATLEEAFEEAWFGHPRLHAKAAKLGWRRRRHGRRRRR